MRSGPGFDQISDKEKKENCMSLVDSLLNVMHMNPDDDEDYYDDDYYDEEDEEEEEPPKRRTGAGRRAEKDSEDLKYSRAASASNNQPIDINRNRDRGTRNNSKVTPMRPSKKSSSAAMEVCVIKPISFNDAREITETLLMNRPVILNVEGLDVDIAQRIIDFASGSCFAISGNLQKISNYIFILTPSNVEISGDFQSLLDTYGTSPIRTDF